MKKSFLLLIFLSVSLLMFDVSPVYSQSGWVLQSPVPNYYQYTTIKFFDINSGYACDVRGIIKTTDSGVSWTESNVDASNYIRWMSFINVNTGFISSSTEIGSSAKIFKTTNAGSNWTLVHTGEISYINFVDANTGYGVNSASIFKSTDGGANWASVNGPETAGAIFSLFFINSMTGFAGGRNQQSQQSIFKTTDGGLHWTNNIFPSTYSIRSITFIDQMNGYFVGGLIIGKTTDGGSSWGVTQLPNFFSPGATSISFTNVYTGYVAVGNSGLDTSIIETTDAGLSWRSILPSWNNGFYSVASVESEYAFAMGWQGQIARTTNHGLNWSYMGSLAPSLVNSLFFINQQTGIAVGRGISRTTNSGANWVPVNVSDTLQSSEYKNVTFINSQTGYAMGGLGNGVIIKTTDGGVTWKSHISSLEYSSFKSMYFVNESSGFLIGDPDNYPTASLLRTTNGGTNWNPVTLYSDSGIALTICFADQNTGYLAGYYFDSSEVYKSTDGGSTWNRLRFNKGRDIELKSLSFPVSNTGYMIGGGNNIYKTTNGGANWTQKTLGVYEINMISFVNAYTGYGVGTGNNYSNEVFKTTDGGDNWIIQNCSQPLHHENGLNAVFLINDSTGWIAGDFSEIYKTTTGGNPIGIKQISQNVPQSFELHQNYPNPFNPITKIKFDIPNTVEVVYMRPVQMILYDILGRKVATLVNENLKPGEYETQWDASNFASGVYFYRLSAGQYTDVKKMVLIK